MDDVARTNRWQQLRWQSAVTGICNEVRRSHRIIFTQKASMVLKQLPTHLHASHLARCPISFPIISSNEGLP